jgi:hypothetical protein
MSGVHNYIGQLVGDGRAPGLCSSIFCYWSKIFVVLSVVELLGWLFDVTRKTGNPNYLTFSKLRSITSLLQLIPFCWSACLQLVPLMILGYVLYARAANILTPLAVMVAVFTMAFVDLATLLPFVFLHTRTVADVIFGVPFCLSPLRSARVFNPLLLLLFPCRNYF